jgi:4'-phosphopantetheinyl transferase
MPTNRDWPPLAEPIELAADDAHVWAVPLDVSQRAYEDFVPTLASDERARANDFRFEAPKRRYVVARSALRRLLGQYLDEQPTAVELAADQNQKPQLAGKHAATGLRFNVSHSGNLALIAVATGCEVGIDVEQLREVGHLEQIARRFFHPLETAAVLAAPEATRSLAFLRCWTGKESVLKALGTGIVGNLADFQVPIRDDRHGWVKCSTGASDGRRSRCWLEQLTPCNGYVAAIACVESKRLVRSYSFTV